MSVQQPWSPAAAFLLAAKAARGSSLGDREYSKLMHDVLATAIRTRMKFEHKELESLESQLNFYTSVGVFRLIDELAYSQACWHESSYAIAYQVAEGLDPWKCPEIFQHGSVGDQPEGIPGLSNCYQLGAPISREFVKRQQTKACKPKVAKGLYVRLPSETTLLRCTALDREQIRFVPFQPEKSKRQRLVFTREQWKALFP